jgi:hypothetical protein
MQDLKIYIHGVNFLEPSFPWEKTISYKNYHVEITATNEQEINLRKRLLSEGLAIGIKPFVSSKYHEADQANEIRNFAQSHSESAGIQIAMILCVKYNNDYSPWISAHTYSFDANL